MLMTTMGLNSEVNNLAMQGQGAATMITETTLQAAQPVPQAPTEGAPAAQDAVPVPLPVPSQGVQPASAAAAAGAEAAAAAVPGGSVDRGDLGKKREKNRIAAAASRARKKEYVQNLEKAIHVLTTEKLELQVKVATLTNQLWEQSIKIDELEKQLSQQQQQQQQQAAQQQTGQGQGQQQSPQGQTGQGQGQQSPQQQAAQQQRFDLQNAQQMN